ncbi:MAG: hypothetical protein U9N87_04490 [Planctomycetota bacterium]|nr:hypothetical protein [Planctomycetota bacterium]
MIRYNDDTQSWTNLDEGFGNLEQMVTLVDDQTPLPGDFSIG